MGRTSRRRTRAALREQHDRRHLGARPDPAAARDCRDDPDDSAEADASARSLRAPDPPPAYTEAEVRNLLLQYARWSRSGDDLRRVVDRHLRELIDVMAVPAHWAVVAAAADHWVGTTIDDARQKGWDDADLVHAVRQLVSARAARFVHLALAARPPDGRPAEPATSGVVERWRAAASLDKRPALSDAVSVVGVFAHLGRLPRPSLPPPGATGADPSLLAKVRALLAKAEATTFPAEAESFTAKAQQLMRRHSIDAAMLAATAGAAGEHTGGGASSESTAVRRMRLDDPYAMQKAELLHVVAEANDSRSVLHASVRIATVVGHPNDLDLVELLFTSLLLQATQAMADAGRASAEDRSVTFRRSFLIAYTVRIAERLADATRAAREEGEQAWGAALVPVLRARAEAVDEAMARLFPTTRRAGGTNAIDPRGWSAGRSAADRADVAGRRPRLAG